MLLKSSAILRKFALTAMFISASIHARPELEPAGLAAYTETARDIYVAGLLVAPGVGLDNIYLAPGPKEMEYRIATRRISSRGFSGTLLLQAEMGSGKRAPEHVISVISELKTKIKGALIQGDQFVISLSADDATSFHLNGTELLQVDDGSIFDFFFAGWVGDTSSSLLRDSLLAGTIDPVIMTRYNNLAPADTRVAVIDDWMQPEPVETVAEVAVVPVAVVPVAVVPVAVAQVAVAAIATVTATSVAQVSMQAKPEPAASAKPEAAPLPVAASIESIVVKAETKAVEEFEPNTLENADKEPVQLALATAAPILEMDDREYQRQVATYVSEVMKSVFSNVKYPRRAIKRQREGKVEMLATLTAEGELAGLALERTSGYDILDKAAVKAIYNAAPFPPLSDAAQEEFLSEDGSTYMVMIPVTFRLQ